MSNKRLPKSGRDKVGQFNLVNKFSGYNARLDPTIVGSNFMVAPSRNVIIGNSGRIGIVPGYVIDGQTSTTIDSGILSNYDYQTTSHGTRNLRCGFLTSTGNDGKLQYRYVDSSGAVSWIDLQTSLTNVRLSFATFSTTAEGAKNVCLWVKGDGYIYEWDGAVTTFASATATTLTKQGTTTWAQDGFYTAKSGRAITINGVSYTYTGGETTTTLTGLSVDLSATPVGTEIHQSVMSTAISSMTGILSTYTPTVIGCGRLNQVYLGSSTTVLAYISKISDYTDYSYSSPRAYGEGFSFNLPATPTAFIASEVNQNQTAYDMWISCGKNDWRIIRADPSSDLTKETLSLITLEVSPLQGAQSNRLVSKVKNHIAFIGHDNVANFFGFISYRFVPVTVDFSYPIIDDMNSYDFSDGSIFYYNNYVFVAVPKEGLIRIYNMTDQTQQNNLSYRGVEDITGQPYFWEAPIGYPISGFYVVDGALYGHSFTTSESYKLFTSGSFNGQDIDANATFGFEDLGDRTGSKASDELYVEGYIKQNTNLNCSIRGDLDGFASTQTVVVSGNNPQYVAYGYGGGSLGQSHLGGQSLGSSRTTTRTLPAWFHVVKTYTNMPLYLEQKSFYTKGIDLQWELITQGTNLSFTTEGNNSITI